MRTIASSCSLPLPLMSSLEIEWGRLAVGLSPRFFQRLGTSPCVSLLPDCYGLTWVSKITGCLVTLFILPSLVKNPKYCSCKALVSLVGRCVCSELDYFTFLISELIITYNKIPHSNSVNLNTVNSM